MPLANFAYSTVATAPSPATSGTSLTLAAGGGALMPAVPFNATVWPIGAQPLSANAEIVTVTAISTDTLTITRAQEGTAARAIVPGDQFSATITKSVLTRLVVPVAFSWTSISFVDSTSYYISYNGVPRTTAGDRDVPSSVAGTISQIDVFTIPTGVNGSNENVQAQFSNLTTGVTTTIGTFSISQGAQITRVSQFTGLSINVTLNDLIALRLNTPAWVTNPTNVIGGAILYFYPNGN